MIDSGNAVSPEQDSTREEAAAVYAQELTSLHQTQADSRRRERLVGYAQLALAAAGLVLAVALLRQGAAIFWIGAPIVLFIALAVVHGKLLESIRYRQRALEFYERGMQRLEDRWAGKGETGERYLDAEHPYARDLDLFGEGSVFQYLSIARTRTGEDTLAGWLLRPASPGDIDVRQQAVKELRARVRLRERFSTAGETVRTGVHPEALAAWGEAKPFFGSKRRLVAMVVLAMLWVASVAAWPLLHLPEALLLMSAVNFGYAHLIHRELEKAAAGIEHAAADLELLAQILSLMEAEAVSSPLLVRLKADISPEGGAASAAIRRLARLAELIEARHSLFVRPLDLVLFWSGLLVMRAERWQRRYGPSIRRWLAAAGKFEALNALAGFAYEHPEFAFPELVQGTACLEAKGMAHPLLPRARAVSNDVRLGDNLRTIILSGPNMAGKSTFMRSIGVNAVLAQCGAPVRARRFRLSPLQVAASICILDSLAGGISRFYAEIHRVKLIADLAQGPMPVLFLLDELLSGTNSHDRHTGTQFVIHTLVEMGALGVVSTHDLALTRIPEEGEQRVANYHFEDRFEDGRLIFDYKIKPGVVQTSNALRLMQSIGLGVPNEDRG